MEVEEVFRDIVPGCKRIGVVHPRDMIMRREKDLHHVAWKQRLIERFFQVINEVRNL